VCWASTLPLQKLRTTKDVGDDKEKVDTIKAVGPSEVQWICMYKIMKTTGKSKEHLIVRYHISQNDFVDNKLSKKISCTYVR
jgi:hypothetical protein